MNHKEKQSCGKSANLPRSKQKVFVGLSGGVDSSVSAALLKEAGYIVTGVFIKVYQPPFLACSAKDDEASARAAAKHLEIPFLLLDLEEVYKKEVIDYMVAEYALGRTPNPDVMCNRSVKFGAFLQLALKEGADYVATGHYARIFTDQNGEKKLLAGADKNKDQSYFLWTLNRVDLAKIIFPVGEMLKKEVRKKAAEINLPNAKRADSQGLCFLGKVNVKDFLRHFIELKKGEVLNEQGEIVGEHPGAALFTIGERHGFLITKKTPHDKPKFVVGKDMANNTLTVADNPLASQIGRREFILEKTNFLVERDFFKANPAKNYLARFRYRAKLAQCQIEISENEQLKIIFSQESPLAVPGQSCVVYDGEVVIAGGVLT